MIFCGFLHTFPLKRSKLAGGVREMGDLDTTSNVMKDEMYQLKVRAVLMRDSDIQLTKICRELHVVNSIFQSRIFIHGMHCIKPKQVKN